MSDSSLIEKLIERREIGKIAVQNSRIDIKKEINRSIKEINHIHSKQH